MSLCSLLWCWLIYGYPPSIPLPSLPLPLPVSLPHGFPYLSILTPFLSPFIPLPLPFLSLPLPSPPFLLRSSPVPSLPSAVLSLPSSLLPFPSPPLPSAVPSPPVPSQMVTHPPFPVLPLFLRLCLQLFLVGEVPMLSFVGAALTLTWHQQGNIVTTTGVKQWQLNITSNIITILTGVKWKCIELLHRHMW